MAAAWEGFVETTAIRTLDALHAQSHPHFTQAWQVAEAKSQIVSKQANNPNGTRTRWLYWQHFQFDLTPHLAVTVRRRQWTDGAYFRDRQVAGATVIEMMDGFFRLRNNIMHGSEYWGVTPPAGKATAPPTGVLARGYSTASTGRTKNGRWRLQDWCAYNCVDIFEMAGENLSMNLAVQLNIAPTV
jgi:hypothetical protein